MRSLLSIEDIEVMGIEMMTRRQLSELWAHFPVRADEKRRGAKHSIGGTKLRSEILPPMRSQPEVTCHENSCLS